MNCDEHIERHLAICQRVYERLLAEGNWPWRESTDPEGMVESELDDTSV